MYIYIHKGSCGKVLTEGWICQESGITWVKKTWNKCSRNTCSTCHGCQESLKNPLKGGHRSWPNCILRRMFQQIYIKWALCYAVSVLALQVLARLSLQTQVCEDWGSEAWTDWSAGWAQSWGLRMCCKTPIEKQGGISQMLIKKGISMQVIFFYLDWIFSLAQVRLGVPHCTEVALALSFFPAHHLKTAPFLESAYTAGRISDLLRLWYLCDTDYLGTEFTWIHRKRDGYVVWITCKLILKKHLKAW